MKAKKGLIIKQIDDEYILIDSGEEQPKFNGMIKLNETSKFIMDELMANELTSDELIDKMLEHYETTKEELQKSVPPILDQLLKVKILVK